MKNETISLALGFFDGVHLGHGVLMEAVKQQESPPAVLTFDCHPGTHLQTRSVPLLTSIEDRTWLIAQKYNIHKVIVAEFASVCNMDWEAFIFDYLQKKLSVSHVVAGHDYRFGRDGQGDATKLQEKCQQLGIGCQIIPPFSLDDEIISSTHIRTLMETGQMKRATELLGHPHILSNTVQQGNKIGGKILGFPTVNLSVPADVITPCFGVYACRIWVGEQVYHAVTNIGIRPTVTDELDKSVTVEGFLLDFPGEELYGQTLRVEFYVHLRNEMKFENFPALSAQIQRDVSATRQFFQENPVFPTT